jgi:hypothetical protein
METGEYEAKAMLEDLLNAFVKHRTATHEVKPTFCETCRESDQVIAEARDFLDNF